MQGSFDLKIGFRSAHQSYEIFKPWPTRFYGYSKATVLTGYKRVGSYYWLVLTG
jgi:hypothetical protein